MRHALLVVVWAATGVLIAAGQAPQGRTPSRVAIPRTWDDAAMASLQVPLATRSATPVHVRSDYYYRIPEMRIYKSYPIYAPGKGPAGYIDWLKQQEPELAFDVGRLGTEEDWRTAGEAVFEAPVTYDTDPAGSIVNPALVRDPEWYTQTGTLVTKDGIMPFAAYVIRKKGTIEVGNLACAMCHVRVMPDGSVINGAQGNFPFDRTLAFGVRTALRGLGESQVAQAAAAVRPLLRSLFAAPWLQPDPLTRIDHMPADQLLAEQEAIPPGVLARHGTSPFSPVQVPDLIGIRERRYLDRTGLVRHRDIGDLMRYAALNQGADDFSDYAGFVPVKMFSPTLPDPSTLETSTIGLQRARYSDEQLYALALWLYSLQPPVNPSNKADAVTARGEAVFRREGCAGCHTPPLYTNNMLTPVPGFTPPAEDRRKYDVMPRSVGTDPTLALKTRRGTGYYKVPSLKGVWYRGPFEHNGSVATLEEWFDPNRLRDDHVPTGFKGHGVNARAVKGHEFGLRLPAAEKQALIAFLKTL